MSRVLVVCLTLLAAVASLPAITFSQLALGGGYRCILIVSNHSNMPWEGTVRVRKGNDEIWNTQWSLNGIDHTGFSGFDLSLPPNGTVKYILASIDATPRAGYLEVVPGGTNSANDVSVSFFYNLNQNGQLIDSVSAVPARLNKRFVLPVETGPGLDTGVAWSPFLSSDTFAMQLSLYDEEGELVKQVEQTFAGHQAQFVTEIFGDLPDPFLGSLVVEGADVFHFTAIRLELTVDGIQLTGVPPGVPPG